MHTPKISINLAKSRKTLEPLCSLQRDVDNDSREVVPGNIVTQQTDLMRGHGTYLDESSDEKVLRSSVVGVVSVVNKLITVVPRNLRYHGEIGDVVVGQVMDLGKKRWRVDVQSNQDAVLQLSYVDLPSGEIRRQNDDDELWMKDYLSENDFLCGQVYSRYSDGSLSLSVRGEKFGKLGQGVLVQVSPSLVKHNKIHFHNMTFGVFVIIGSNGYIWISPSQTYLADNDVHHLERQYSEEEYIKVSRMRACILALSQTNTPIYDMTMLYMYEASLNHEVSDLQKPEVIHEIINLTREMYIENSAK